MLPILQYMIENPTLTINQIGKKFGLSSPTLSKKIKSIIVVDNIQKARYDMGIVNWINYLKEIYDVLFRNR
jgi:hypothetical protein